jgi:hypothetical protein
MIFIMGTLYPSILAEYRASKYNIGTLADHAGVTVELMNTVLYKGEDLTINELKRLRGLFSFFGERHYSLSYLVSPRLSIIEPHKNKTRFRFRTLRGAIVEIEAAVESGVEFDFSQRDELKQAYSVIDRLTLFKTSVTYADYAWALNNMRFLAQLLKPKQRRGLKKKGGMNSGLVKAELEGKNSES